MSTQDHGVSLVWFCIKSVIIAWDWFDTCYLESVNANSGYMSTWRTTLKLTAHQVVSVRDNPKWRRFRGCLQNLWLEQVDRSCQELLGMGRGLAWGLVRRTPRFGIIELPWQCAPWRIPPLIDWLISMIPAPPLLVLLLHLCKVPFCEYLLLHTPDFVFPHHLDSLTDP